MLRVAGGIKGQQMTYSQWRTAAGALAASWDSARELGELSDTWRREKRWAVTGCDPDRLWTGQSVGLCGKLGRG